ncbi:VOC family protein [Mangrovimicrobium sediminis]|uniref:VOC family protein n=1 Tax=Mangrovimicrobium sediminis TaxID=2562682 RepID=A0A4Z0LWW3_9GAMM|nr:VOC family protein [Haliea sp. SAOS-164]TGD71779.1 VOC family protein [Haliea sp. SAOS-164]
MPPKPTPDGYHSITPYLSITGAARALEFYTQAFGAQERFHMEMPDGRLGHAELQIGDSVLMLADACPEIDFPSASEIGGTAVGIHLYVEDVDAVFAQALQAGATELQPVADQFYGDRTGTLRDPFGHMWFLATHKEDLTPEELRARAESMNAQLET